MSYDRRQFIKTTSAAMAITAITGELIGCNSSSRMGGSGTLKEFGLQLYTLRDVFPKDPKGVLKQVAEMGYKQVESFEGASGIFWGMSNVEFKKYMDDLGMQIISSHCDINKDFEKKANEAAAIGMKYLLAPYLGPQKNIDAFKKYAEKFNQLGEVCKKAGLRFGYHNHDYSFKPVEGQYPQDVMMQNTDASLVDYEMDIYWVVAAGQDPVKWFEKYPGRFRLCHIKDRKKGAPLLEHDASVILGTGSIDFAHILKTAAKSGMKYYIVEQEKYEGSTSLASAKADADYLKQLKF
jgi:sugar phosphate isomerase/epimerase